MFMQKIFRKKIFPLKKDKNTILSLYKLSVTELKNKSIDLDNVCII